MSEETLTWLEHTQTVNGKKWVKGFGKLPSDYMIIGEKPSEEDVSDGRVFAGPGGRVLSELAREVNFDLSRAYMTNAVKYDPGKRKAITAGDLKACKGVLDEEIKRCQPKIIITLGANALKSVMGRKYKLGDYRGAMIDHLEMDGVKVFPMYSPSYVLRNPEMRDACLQDWQKLAMADRGETVEVPEVDNIVVHTLEELKCFKEFLFAEYDKPLLVVDCEWNGCTWMHDDRYVRLVQIGYDDQKALIVELWGEGTTPEGEPWTPDCKEQLFDDIDGAWAVLKEILEDPRVELMGHNVISDGEWLLSYDIDIRPRVVFDTMLAEHTINEMGPFSLTELTLKYTQYGRYDMALVKWVDDHKGDCIHGYGPVPRDLILPYAGLDVDVPRQIAKQQIEKMGPFMEPRGVNGEYPSLWQTVMDTQRNIYELELSGLAVDRERLQELRKVYSAKLAEITSVLVAMAQQNGIENFNFKSTPQVRKLLFDILQLTPIKTTDNKEWSKAVSACSEEEQALLTPSTDKNTLDILQDAHPIVKILNQARKLDMIVKTWLRLDPSADPSTSGGGIESKIWPDGRLHTHFSQLSDTGRFRHSKPNSANWPKKAESYMIEIFGGKENIPPGLRTIIVPAPGYVLMEGDFVQAELFVLAALSGDKNMWEALNTPGKDMHDMTAISSFSLQVLGPDQEPIPEQQLLDLAASDPDAFDELQDKLLYLDTNGKILTRKDFKSGIRISAKNLNFGIPYGRGALDIARQVRGETGTDTSVDVLKDEIEQMMTAWKTVTYASAWSYMESCAAAAIEPGYLVNPWGRMRRFAPSRKRDVVASMQREAQNFPIQSTVADTCAIAMQLMVEYRRSRNLHFKMVNQIHDAIMLEVPENEIEQTKQMFIDTMGSIDIPITGREPLRLGVDIEVLTRWGEKVKQ